MGINIKRFRVVMLCVVAYLLSGMAVTVAQSAKDKPESRHDESPVVARVYGQEIHLAEVDARIGSEAYDLQKKLFTLRKQAIDDMVSKSLLSHEADRRGMTVEQLLDFIAKSAPAPDKAEVERQYSENKPSFADLGELVGRYRVLLELQAEQRTQTVHNYVDALKRQAGAETLLEEPTRDLQLAATACHIGNENAPVQLVEFIDYDCPFCKKLGPSLASLVQSQPVEIVIKQMPLSIHKTARQAALAATCAANQHRFSAFHERLLSASDHSDDALLQLAKEAGLNTAQFSKCMKSEEANRQVEMDVADATKLGVNATPSLFLNGAKVDYSDSNDLLRQVSAEVVRTGNTSKADTAGGNR